MAELSDLTEDVLEQLEKCSAPQAESALEDTAIDFLKRSKLWSIDLAPISIVAGTAQYALPNPQSGSPLADYAQILHIRSATIGGKPLTLTSEEYLDLNWQELSKSFNWRFQFSDPPASSAAVDDWRLAESEQPGLAYQLDPNHITLVGIPTVAAADALKVKVVIFPLRGVTAIENWIFNSWHQVLVAGAINRLKMMPDKPWSDRAGAALFLDDYETGIGLAAAESLRGFKRNDQQARRTKVW
jgi:hypothetical protein